MTIDTLDKDLKGLTDDLLEMARNLTWNEISNDCRYILTEIVDSDKNFFEQRKLRKRLNDSKIPRDLNLIVPDLKTIFENIYDLNLYVYKAKAEQTIIEIQYYPKSNLNKDYLEKVKDNKPMLHCKIATPPYAVDNKVKFDINWELGGLRHEWKMFWWRQNVKRELRKRKNDTLDSL